MLLLSLCSLDNDGFRRDCSRRIAATDGEAVGDWTCVAKGNLRGVCDEAAEEEGDEEAEFAAACISLTIGDTNN